MDLIPNEAAIRRATVERDIRAAFAGAETRPAPPMVRAELDDAYYRDLEVAFQEHPGQPTPEFLDSHAGEARYLQPQAERWFWRSLLLAALEIPWDRYHDDRTLFYTLLALRPNPCAVRERRTDYDDAQNLRERLTPAERLTVAGFLRLAVEDPWFAGKPMAYLASQAIAWCWNDDPAATRAAAALRATARAYRRPPADDPDNEALIAVVERAFAATPAPVGSPMEGLSEEPSEYAVEFEGADWRTLAPWFLDFHYAAFSFMTPAAFRYFLPAAMCQTLGPGAVVSIDFHLVDCLVDPSSYREAARARVATFSAPERAAVAAFLRNSSGWEHNPDAYETAVHEFWDPTVGSPE